MILCILGRQPELGLAELSALYPGKVSRFGKDMALVKVDYLDVQSLGGTQKAARIIYDLPHGDWAMIGRKIINKYTTRATQNDLPKLTIGFSVYLPKISLRQVNKLGLNLKTSAKKFGKNIRIIPNSHVMLNTATSHHNKLGLSENKKEIIVAGYGSHTLIAESIGAQNITALAQRDQGRPKRDTFVGMLPPKLALIMYNIGIGTSEATAGKKFAQAKILDPFCGTGVVLQEAYLRGAMVYGTDLSNKMVDFSRQNLAWLVQKYPSAHGKIATIQPGDATTHTWNFAQSLSAVVCETYLGQPFSASPSPTKLAQVRGNCNHIISSFLVNLHPQISQATTLCIAVPAWRNHKNNTTTRLPLINQLDKLGYQNLNQKPLLYFREDQVVARDILILRRL